jgi:hypothetical protein
MKKNMLKTTKARRRQTIGIIRVGGEQKLVPPERDHQVHRLTTHLLKGSHSLMSLILKVPDQPVLYERLPFNQTIRLSHRQLLNRAN